MSQEYEIKYNQFLSELARILPKIDTNFACRMMYLERKLENESPPEPHVALTIEYKSEVDRDAKRAQLRDQYNLEVDIMDEPNKVLSMDRMFLEKINKIASDPDILKITGKASPTVRT